MSEMVYDAKAHKDSVREREYDAEARNVIEALRSGVPSRAVGKYFTDARPALMRQMSDQLEQLKHEGETTGMIITGRYGEGKTHLLNTVMNMAQSSNMVVSYFTISKESPFDKIPVTFQKMMANTYLPGRRQPGMMQLFETMSAGSPVAAALMDFADHELQTDKLYYVLKAYLHAEDAEDRFRLAADLQGDFIALADLRKIYKKLFGQTIKFKTNFSKTKHSLDYFSFMSRVFKELNFDGWVILVDEAELLGRLGKKARIHAYRNMAYFLMPEAANKQAARAAKDPDMTGKMPIERGQLASVFSLFAFSASYPEEVIEKKHELDNLFAIYPANKEPVRTVIQAIAQAQELQPLTKQEMRDIIAQIQDFHGRAYGWSPDVPVLSVQQAAEYNGILLRTKLRCAIEFYDQLYQYGEAGQTRVNELGQETYEEDVPALDALLEDAEK